MALGVYDFDLVLFVAEKSQKDPKEFLPFLNELKAQPEFYRRFSIDKHLKRYSSALKNIAKQCSLDEGYREECLALIRDQRLYKEAMALFDKSSGTHKDICKAYGTYLMSKKYFEDSALVFESGGWLEDAVEAWSFSSDWMACLAAAKPIKDTVNFAQLCRKIVDKLINERRFQVIRIKAFILILIHCYYQS